MSSKSLGQLTLDMILKTGSYTEPLNKAARQTKQVMQDIEKDATQTSDIIQNSFAALGFGISINEIRKYSDTWTDLNSRVRLAVAPMEDANEVMTELEQIARKTYSSLENSASGYLLNASALRELGFSTKEQLQFTNALAAGLVASGAKADQAASVTDAFSKSIAEGVLRGDNWNTVFQTGGQVADALARSLGMTRAELDKMARSGGLTAEKVVKALIDQMDDLQTKADSMTTTVGDAFVQLDNAALRVFGTLADSSGATGLTSAAIMQLVDNLELVVDIAAIAAAVMAGRLAAAATANAIQFVIATREAARYQLSLATMAGVSANTAKNLLFLDAATKTLNRSLAFLGGPVGLLFAAGAAASYFALTSKSSALEAQKMGESIDYLNGSMEKLNAAQAGRGLVEIQPLLTAAQDDARVLGARVEYLQKQLEKFPSNKDAKAWRDELAIMNGKWSDAKELVQQYVNQLTILQQVAKQSDAEKTAPISDDFVKQAAALNRQIELFGKTGEAAKLLYEIQSGSMAGKLSDAEQKTLLALAEKLDWLNKNADAAKRLADEQKNASATVLDFIENARNTQGALQEQIDGTDRLGRSRQELIKFERQLSDIKEKKTLTAFEKEFLAQEMATRAQLEKNVALEEEVRIRNGLAGLFVDMQTDEEKRFELFKQRVKILEDAKKLTGTVDVEMAQRVTGDLFEDSPMSARLDVSVSGPAGELDRIAEEEKTLNDWYQRQTEMLNQARSAQLDANIDWNAQELALKDQHEKALGQIESQRRTAQLAVMGDFFSHLASMQNSESKKARQVAKTAAIAQALINTYQAATGAYAAMAPIPVVGPALGAAAAAAAIVAGMANVSAIRGQAHNGLDYIPREGTWILDKGERVLSPRQNEDLTRFLSAVESDSGSTARGKATSATPEIKFYLQAPNQEAMLELLMSNRAAIAGMVSSAFEDQGIVLG